MKTPLEEIKKILKKSTQSSAALSTLADVQTLERLIVWVDFWQMHPHDESPNRFVTRLIEEGADAWR